MNVERRFKKARATLEAAIANGAGLLMDKELRDFLQEFNSRLWKHGPESMPSSFNVLRPFYYYDRDLLMFRLEAERDHLFSFSDFVDFATSSDAPHDPFEAARSIPVRSIHSFNNLDDPHDITFSTESGGEYGVGGVSFVCEGNELTVMIVGGRISHLEAETQLLDSPAPFEPSVGRWAIQPAENLKLEAAPLPGTQDMWKILAIARVDLKKRSEDVRYVLTDAGNRFLIDTDDPQILDETLFGRPNLVEEKLTRLNEMQVLFELCKTAFLLPSYFAFKITLVREQKTLTNFGRLPTLPSQEDRSATGRPASHEKVVYRTVSALRIQGSGRTRSVRRFTPPQFNVQVEGFWRRLRPDSLGRDSNNEPVMGRTWVRSHLRWRSQPPRPIEVLVKSKVSMARAIAEAEAQIRSIAIPETTIAVAKPETTGASDDSATHRPEIRVSREEAYRERSRLTARLRWRILERDNFRCTICGADGASDPNVRLDVDHVVPIAGGGKTEPSNLRTLCNKCNNGKGDLFP
jgi:hypothetical protein